MRSLQKITISIIAKRYVLIKMLKEGNPSATATLRGALYVTTNINNVKPSTKLKKK